MSSQAAAIKGAIEILNLKRKPLLKRVKAYGERPWTAKRWADRQELAGLDVALHQLETAILPRYQRP